MKEEKKLPEGWEWKKLNDISDKVSLNKIKIKQKSYLPEGKYPVVDQGQDLIGGYFNDEKLVVPGAPPYIIFGDHTKIKKYVDFKFISGADGVKVLKAKDTIDPKFLFYSLFTIKIRDNGYARHFQLLEKELFPLPPLPEQQQIVSKIEELFSELDKSKEQLLTAQAQLKVYRQAVLKHAFEGKLTNKNVKEGELPVGWKLVRMRDTIEKPKYGTSKKCDYSNEGIGVLRIPNIGNGFIDSSDLKFAIFEKDEIETYRLHAGDIIIIRSNGSLDLVGKCALVTKFDEQFLYAGYLIRLRPLHNIIPKYLLYILSSSDLRSQIESKAKSTSGVNNINSEEISSLNFYLPSFHEQQQIVLEIESRLSVCDKLEENITQSLLQAEALRQSILKKAFEGKLVSQEKNEVAKPKNLYFHQVQVLALIIKKSKQKEISHGEMTIAKYTYLLDRIYGIPSYYEFNRLHLGPYPVEMKKAINNKTYFKISNYHIDVVNEENILKYNNSYKDQISAAIDELAAIFLNYNGKERSHKTELLATVCKVIEDIQSTDLKKIRLSMQDWKIDLKTTPHKSKAEKFTEAETKKCVEFIVEKGWDKKLI